MAAAVTATLAAAALPVYTDYVTRAQLAQLLLQTDQIATAVTIEDATGVRGLQRNAQAGKSPAGLGTVPDSSFNEPGGLRLLLIRAPAGFFASSPLEARYGLVADMAAPGGTRRLGLLRKALPFAEGDKLWIGEGQLAFPIVARLVDSDAAPAPPVPPAASNGWESMALAGANGTWSCQATLSVYGTDGKLMTAQNAGVRITVTLDVTTWDGKQITRSWTDQGNLTQGKASFKVSNLSAQAGNGEVITGVHLQVTGMDYYWPNNPEIKWNGNLATIAIAKPPP